MAYFTSYICSYKLDDENILLLNTLSGAIDIVDGITFDKINEMMCQGENIVVTDKLLYLTLKKRGYIFDSKREENMIFKSIREAGKKICDSNTVVSFTVCPSMGCNLRCTYCYENHNDQHNNFDIMSENQLDTIFKYIIEFCRKKNISECRIGIFGGEPLLKKNYQIVKRIMEFAVERNFLVCIATNGTGIDDRYMELLKKHKEKMYFQITLDGNKYYHNKKRIYNGGEGTFDDICVSIQRILDANIRLTIRINVDRENINSLSDLKCLFIEKHWRQNPLVSVYASPIRYYEYGDKCNAIEDSEMLDIFMKNQWISKDFVDRLDSSVFDCIFGLFGKHSSKIKLCKTTYCSATDGSSYCFTPNGVITTCLRCVGDCKYKVGTFNAEGKVFIDESSFNGWINRDFFSLDKCKKCKFMLLCGGGCPVYSLKQHNNINCPVCNDIKKTLEVYIKYMKNDILHKLSELR